MSKDFDMIIRFDPEIDRIRKEGEKVVRQYLEALFAEGVVMFGGYLKQLQVAGVCNLAGEITQSARRYWGGVTANGVVVVTAWEDEPNVIWRPRDTNHGGLRAIWKSGGIAAGARVRLILLKQKGNKPPTAEGDRQPGKAALLPDFFCVTRIFPSMEDGFPGALILPCSELGAPLEKDAM